MARARVPEHESPSGLSKAPALVREPPNEGPAAGRRRFPVTAGDWTSTRTSRGPSKESRNTHLRTVSLRRSRLSLMFEKNSEWFVVLVLAASALATGCISDLNEPAADQAVQPREEAAMHDAMVEMGGQILLKQADLLPISYSRLQSEVLLTVKNVGLVASGPFTVYARINDLWQVRSIGGLSAGQTFVFRFTNPRPSSAGSTWYFDATVDCYNQVWESNEKNNVLSVSIVG